MYIKILGCAGCDQVNLKDVFQNHPQRYEKLVSYIILTLQSTNEKFVDFALHLGFVDTLCTYMLTWIIHQVQNTSFKLYNFSLELSIKKNLYHFLIYIAYSADYRRLS
jgi:hypothetical protein